MKSYTDLEQSKKLAEILPVESADMWYSVVDDETFVCLERHYEYELIPCWSLAALLDVLSYPSLHKTYRAWRCDTYNEEGDVQQIGEDRDNPIDACYEMILKLHEQKLI